MHLTEFHYFSQDGLKLYSREWIPDNSKKKLKGVICIIHGLGEHSGRYSHMAEFFTDKGYIVEALDIRGHGKSDGKRGYSPHYDFIMNDISGFLEEVKNRHAKDKIFLFGHSLGGNFVLNFALRKKPKISAVIASGSLLKPAFKPSAVKVLLGKMMYNIMPGLSMNNGLDINMVSHDPEVVRKYLNDPLVHDRITPRFAMDFLNAGLWALENAGSISLPLLIMHGGGDRITSAEASSEFAKKSGKKCTFKIWDGCYHEVHNEPVQNEFFKYIADWIGKIK
jgi:acylglycerol lipase